MGASSEKEQSDEKNDPRHESLLSVAGILAGLMSADAAALSGSIRVVAAGMGTAGAMLGASDARGAGPSKSSPSKPVRCSDNIVSNSVAGIAASGMAKCERVDPLAEDVGPAVRPTLVGGRLWEPLGDTTVASLVVTAAGPMLLPLIAAIGAEAVVASGAPSALVCMERTPCQLS